MNIGRAITASMRAQRRRDLTQLLRELRGNEYYAFQAWLWWGWRLLPTGKYLGMGGACWPWWTEPKWMR